jgi:hypothetical protein
MKAEKLVTRNRGSARRISRLKGNDLVETQMYEKKCIATKMVTICLKKNGWFSSVLFFIIFSKRHMTT